LGRRFGKNIARRLIQKFENYRLPDGLSAGDICSIESGSGGFGIVKILDLEPGTVHIRLYKEKFASKPDLIDATGLSLGTVHDEDGFGIGHLPLSARNFAHWEPMIIGHEEISPEELEGYNLWKESGGGVWG
jgi:hypothetical protein